MKTKYFTFKHNTSTSLSVKEFEDIQSALEELTGGSVYSRFGVQDIEAAIEEKGFFSSLNNYGFFEERFCSLIIPALNLQEAFYIVNQIKGGRASEEVLSCENN